MSLEALLQSERFPAIASHYNNRFVFKPIAAGDKAHNILEQSDF
jgi:hypothetical protein